MLLNLTEKSDEPLHHSQILWQLTDKIVDGDLQDGAELDPIRKLATWQRVCVNTVKRACYAFCLPVLEFKTASN